MSDLNWLDALILAIFLLSALLGMWRGLASEALALLAWVAAFFAARAWGGSAAQLIHINAYGMNDPGIRHLTGFIIVFVLTLLIFSIARWLAKNMLQAIGLGLADRLLGIAFGCGRALFIIWIGVLLAGLTPLPQQRWWQASTLVPPLETAVIATKPWLPPSLAERLHYRHGTRI